MNHFLLTWSLARECLAQAEVWADCQNLVGCTRQFSLSNARLLLLPLQLVNRRWQATAWRTRNKISQFTQNQKNDNKLRWNWVQICPIQPLIGHIHHSWLFNYRLWASEVGRKAWDRKSEQRSLPTGPTTSLLYNLSASGTSCEEKILLIPCSSQTLF